MNKITHTGQATAGYDIDENLRLVIQNSPIAMGIESMDDGRHLEINEHFLKLYGVNRSEIINHSAAELGIGIEPGLRKILVREIQTSGAVPEREIQITNQSGQLVTTLFSATRLRHENKDFILSQFADISALKQAENEIRKDKIMVREAQHLAHIGNWELDLLTQKLSWSDEIYAIFEIAPDQFAASYEAFLNAVHPEDREEVNTAYLESLKSHHPYEATHRLLMPDGRIKYVIEKCKTYYDEQGKPLRSIGTMQDITERKHLETQLMHAQKMESIGTLAGGVAHDFNNLLHAILGFLELIFIDTPPSDPNYSHLQEIKRAAQRAADLTRQLLAFSRRQILKLSVLEINQVLSELLEMLHRLIGEDIELIFLPDNELSNINADRVQVEQLIVNLCVNARDAMPQGGRLIIETENIYLDNLYVATHEWALPGSYILIKITDTGCGIDQASIKKIFEPFFTTKDQHQGTGLGLSTVYGIVRQHQGMVQVYSEIGHGTCFKIYFPASPTREQAAQLPQPVATPVTGGSETILLAEDEEQLRNLAQQVLEKAGYHVITAADGEEALNIYQLHDDEISLLFLDAIMPKQNGRAVYDAIRAINPDIKCLFASGYSREGLHRNFILEEDLHLLQKPYCTNHLLQTVRMILDEETN